MDLMASAIIVSVTTIIREIIKTSPEWMRIHLETKSQTAQTSRFDPAAQTATSGASSIRTPFRSILREGLLALVMDVLILMNACRAQGPITRITVAQMALIMSATVLQGVLTFIAWLDWRAARSR